jgi:hypothetical protein
MVPRPILGREQVVVSLWSPRGLNQKTHRRNEGDEVNENQANKTFNDMLPDYLIGNKVRRKGAENFGSPEDRHQRSQRLDDINRDVVLDWVFVKKRPLGSLRHGKRYQDVADLYYRRHHVKISPKTVERALKDLRCSSVGANHRAEKS